MANTGDTIYQILKWSIVVITLINVIIIGIEFFRYVFGDYKMDVSQVVFFILSIVIFCIGLWGAYKEDVLFLLICGVALICNLIFGAIIHYAVHGDVMMVILIILLFVFAFFVHRGGVTTSA